MNFLKFWTSSVHLFEHKVTLKIIRNLNINHTESDYSQYVVLNDSMSGRELQIRKAKNISWKINKKISYRPSDHIRHT